MSLKSPPQPFEQAIPRTIIHRSVCHIQGKPLVLFHKNGVSLEPRNNDDIADLAGRLNVGPIIELANNAWTWCNASPENFNCHTLAIGSSVGLTPSDWLEGKASTATLQENPVELLLSRFFKPVSDRIRDNDVFVLKDSTADHFVHSGFVRWIDGRLVAISKFGERPIYMTSIELVAAIFGNSFDEITWYRTNAA